MPVTVNGPSAVFFLLAIAGWVLSHVDLMHRFHRFKARIFLTVLGPMLGYIGLYTVIGGMAENHTIGPFAFFANLMFGCLGVWVILFRPFRNGEMLYENSRQQPHHHGKQ